jgi:prolipoprotein diacylglyceryltransferase
VDFDTRRFLAIMLLELQVRVLWSLYSRFPTHGYEEVWTEGKVTPSLAAPSDLIMPVTLVVLGMLGAVTVLFVRGKARAVLPGLWPGAMAAYCAMWLATPALRQDSNMWPIDLVVMEIGVSIPLVIGGLLGKVLLRNEPK